MQWAGFITSRYLRLSEWGELLLIGLVFIGIGAIAYAIFQRFKPEGEGDVSLGAYILIALIVGGLLARLLTNIEWLSTEDAASRILEALEREQREGVR